MIWFLARGWLGYSLASSAWSFLIMVYVVTRTRPGSKMGVEVRMGLVSEDRSQMAPSFLLTRLGQLLKTGGARGGVGDDIA